MKEKHFHTPLFMAVSQAGLRYAMGGSMMKDITIKKASAEDAAAILDYLNQVGGESDNLLFGANGFSNMSVEKEAELITSINNSPRDIMLIGKIENEIVSICSLQGFTRERTAHRGSIAISVKKKYWHQGIASKMISELITFGRDTANMTVLELQVKADNENAINLYNKFGFKQIGVYEKFFKINNIYYDAILMNLYL